MLRLRLHPTEELVVDLLMNRRLLGHTAHAFPQTLRPSLLWLAKYRVVGLEDGPRKGTVIAWLTQSAAAELGSNVGTPRRRMPNPTLLRPTPADWHPKDWIVVELLKSLHLQGEVWCTFSPAHRPAIQRLGEQGIVQWRDGRTGHPIVAWLAGEGRDADADLRPGTTPIDPQTIAVPILGDPPTAVFRRSA